jgi:hypothetical protein
MAIPVQRGDITVTFQAIAWIKNHCFSRSNRADSRYTEFKQDLHFFEQHLLRLKNVFDTAAEQLEHQDMIWDHDRKSRYFNLRRDSRELIGDFGATIDECKSLLTRYSAFDIRRSSALESGIWHLSAQDEVNELKNRLKFHAHKISLIIEPMELDLTTTISGRVDEILAIVRRESRAPNPVTLPDIPDTLAGRFRSSLQVNPPQTFSNIEQMPLKEGFDALYERFQNSTFQFINPEHSPQTVQQYLNLIKAHWLHNVLVASESLRSTESESLFRRAICQLELRIAKEHSRPDITRYNEVELLELEECAFRIWPEVLTIAPPRLQHEPDKQLLEEKLVKLSLPKEGQFGNRELHVIRVTEKILRIVLIQSFGERPESSAMAFNVHEDRLLPWYAINSSPELQVTTGSGACGQSIKLHNRTDAIRLQSVFTGYDVYLPMTPFDNATITITYSPRKLHFKRMQEHGTGEIQLWEWPTNDAGGRQLELSIVPSSPSTRKLSNGSAGSIHSVASRITQNLDPSIVTFRADMNSSGGGVLFAKLQRPPLIVGFTQKDDLYTMWHIDGRSPSPSLLLQNY